MYTNINNQNQNSKYDYSFFLFCNTGSTNGYNISSNFIKKQNKQYEQNPQSQQFAQMINMQNNNITSKKQKNKTQQVDLKWGEDKITFQVQISHEDYLVTIYFVNLNDKNSKIKGMNTLNKLQKEKNTNIRTIASGGDGTIVWMIDELINFNCDLQNLALTAIPVGTGNDFCNAFGWGDNLNYAIGSDKFTVENLKKLSIQWINSDIQDLDVWDIEVETQEQGSINQIKKVNDQYCKQEKKDEQGNTLKFLKSHMVNYFSIGLDAHIGYLFDKHRTQSLFLNKFFYFWEGLLKLFQKKISITTIIDKFSVIRQNKKKNSDSNEIDQDIEEEKTLFQSNEQTIFKVKSNQDLNSNFQEDYDDDIEQNNQSQNKIQDCQLVGTPITLTCQNITSYCAGAVNAWEYSKKIGIQDSKNNPVNQKSLNLQFQDPGDGKLEFLTFSNIIEFILERYINGFGYKICQNSGPFKIDFKKFNYQQKKQILTHFQIDGEYYEIQAPKHVIIKQSNDLKFGKVKVMVNCQKTKEIQQNRQKWKKYFFN